MLHTSHMIAQHTAIHVTHMFEKMVQNWDLTGRIHVMMRDNAPAMDDAHIPPFGCVSRTLQLVVNKALKVKHIVEVVVGICRRTATHFHKSSLAKKKLERIRQSQRLPLHAIIQDVSVRQCACISA